MSLLDKQIRVAGRGLLVVTLLALLTGCGFRLQGTGGYPEAMDRTYINASDRYTVFYRKLLAQLEKDGITVVESPLDAGAVIDIEDDETARRVLTISGRNVPREYIVYYRVAYSVRIGAETVVPTRRLSLDQDFTYDAREVLGKNREEENLRDALAESLVAQLKRDIARLD